jgi:peptidyl-tRNA hydrolase
MSLVQYVVVRGDLLKHLGWPFGAVIAQACHACTAALHLYREDAQTRAYLSDLDRMHKVSDEASLRALAETLTTNGIQHKMWIEQPEDIPTCIATKPYPKADIQNYFKRFKLFKN